MSFSDYSHQNLFSALKTLDPRSIKSLSSQIGTLIETKLWAKVLAGMILGVCTGVLLSPNGPLAEFVSVNKSTIDSLMGWMAFPAQFFLKVIKMVIIPLIFSSIIRGLGSTTDLEQMKRLGLRFTSFVIGTTVVACGFGIFITKMLNPGGGLSLSGKVSPSGTVPSAGIFSLSPETLLNILPVNPLSSFVEGQMLDVVIISIIAGIAILSIKNEQAKSVMDMLEVIQQICMRVISWAMRIAPYAVFGMMTQVAATTGLKALKNMAFYVTCSFIGFSLFILFYALLVWILKGYSPVTFLKKISTPLLLAFSTSSSAATMPLTMKVAEEELAADPSVARFLIPLGTTVNMAGSSIWHTSAVVFLSQAYDIQLTIPQITLVAATSVASSIGSPGVPGVGIGILSAILLKVGVPIEGLSLIMGVDRIIDMGCTVVNVAGDLTASKIFSRT